MTRHRIIRGGKFPPTDRGFIRLVNRALRRVDERDVEGFQKLVRSCGFRDELPGVCAFWTAVCERLLELKEPAP